ncbi:hypothetical protein JHK85_027416 [Glycine max]|nr:hypothetical protein JHK85_027416 [Glycine max]
MDHSHIVAALSAPHGGDASDAAKRGKKRGSYNCGRCGLPKKGHNCTVKTPASTAAATPDSSLSIVSLPSSSAVPSLRQSPSNLGRALSFDDFDEPALVVDRYEPDEKVDSDVFDETNPDLDLDADAGGLPASLMWEVMRRLPPPGLLSAAKVCKGWRDTTKRLWRAVEELKIRVPANVPVRFVASMLQKCPGIVRLSLRMESDFDSTMLACIAFSCPNLECMKILTFDAAIIRINGILVYLTLFYGVNVFNCPQLREISLEFSCLENDSTDLKTMIEGLGRSCPRLQNIHIASIRLSHSAVLALTAAQLRGLRMLSLVLGSEITDASVAAIASSYPNLELLDLSGSGVSDSGISMICNVFPDTLTRLLLALCPNVTSSGIQFATFQLPHLEIMDCGMTICDPNTENPTADENNCKLQKTSGVNVHLINQKLIIKHSRLKKLSLWGCTGLDALYLNCPRLIDLNLNSCSNLHPGRLLLQCPNLENVHASGCQDMLIGAIQSQVHDASAEMENHSQSKRLPDGSKRIRVPHLLSEEEFPEPEKKQRKIERQLCNVLLD